MYVFLKEGPVHLVEHRREKNNVIARGWSRTALARFLTTSTIDLTESIYLDETADYCWRAQISREEGEQCLKDAYQRIDYDSLKAGVARVGDDTYYDHLVSLHELCKRMMDPRQVGS